MDMTESQLDGNALHRAALRTLEQAGEAIAIVSTDVRYLWVNSEFSRVTGYGAEDVIGKPLAMMRAGVHDDAFYQSMRDTIFRDGVWHGEVWRRRKNGEAFPALLTVSAVYDEAGNLEHYVDFFSDLSAANSDRERIEFLINHDALTEMPNRRLFRDRLATAIKRARRREGKVALIFIDLDNFKAVNDRLGHAEGDRLLARIGGELQRQVRDADTIARVGGDEFVVLLEGGDPDALEAEYVERINTALRRVAAELPAGIDIGASLGIAVHPRDGTTPDALYHAADRAMYADKAERQTGGSRR
jgi:diguanylate cyclase (GGDEF)-like protein/PAS domain S-box-containing protein